MTPFRRRVLSAVADLPAGEVVTYGEVANEIGHPGAARAVGTVLRDAGQGVPWWRVVPASGRLVDHLVERQSTLLEAEGVTVVGGRIRATTVQDPGPARERSTGPGSASYRDAASAGQD